MKKEYIKPEFELQDYGLDSLLDDVLPVSGYDNDNSEKAKGTGGGTFNFVGSFSDDDK